MSADQRRGYREGQASMRADLDAAQACIKRLLEKWLPFDSTYLGWQWIRPLTPAEHGSDMQPMTPAEQKIMDSHK